MPAEFCADYTSSNVSEILSRSANDLEQLTMMREGGGLLARLQRW